MGLELGEVGLADRLRVDVLHAALLQADEARQAVQVEVDLDGIEDLEQDRLVAAEREPADALEDRVEVVEEVGEDGDDAAAREPRRDPGEDLSDAGRTGGLGLLERGEDRLALRGAVTGGHLAARVPVEDDQPDRVALGERQVRERRGGPAGVVELAPAAGAVGHRLAGVDEQVQGEVRLLDELLDHQAVRAGEDLPVQPLQLVPGDVLAVLLELDRGPPVGGAVLAGLEALDHRACHQRQLGQPVEDGRVQGLGGGAQAASPLSPGLRRRRAGRRRHPRRAGPRPAGGRSGGRR